jgi:hypothetical protein
VLHIRVCEQSFEFCLADDPRSAAGVGADNMTLVIVALKELNDLQRELEAVKNSSIYSKEEDADSSGTAAAAASKHGEGSKEEESGGATDDPK